MGKRRFRVALFVAMLAGIWFVPSPQAQAKPVEYVKVCSVYGAGFYYVPGTDTCIKLAPPTFRDGTICSYGGRPFFTDSQVCPSRPANLQPVVRCGTVGPGIYGDSRVICGDIRTNTAWGTFQPQTNFTAVPYGTTTSGPLSFAVMGGALWTHASSSYSSTGTQAPGSFSSNNTGGDFYAQLKYMQQLGNGVSMGFGLNGGVNASGEMTLFDIIRHRTNAINGHVIGTLDPGAVVNPFIELRAPIVPGTYAWIAPGAMFQEQRLSLSSDQTGFGGKLETASTSYWSTGFDLRGGISQTICPSCLFNQPLTVSVGGNYTWFNSSQSLGLRSSTFGFTETAKVDNTRQYGAQVKLTTPVAWGERWRVHRDFGF